MDRELELPGVDRAATDHVHRRRDTGGVRRRQRHTHVAVVPPRLVDVIIGHRTVQIGLAEITHA